MMWLDLLLMALLQAAGVQPAVSGKLERLPLKKENIQLEPPRSYAKSILRYDPKTKAPIYYDPKPRVIHVDQKSGKYALKWVSTDRREKTVLYQRPDAIDVVVSASVSRRSFGRYMYVYTVMNLRSSGEDLGMVAIQTFSTDVEPLRSGNYYVGPMSNNRVMSQGHWIAFGFSGYKPIVRPGGSIQVSLESSAPAGLVEIRIAGGSQGMKGVGEEMPQELANILPGYEAWPRGYTIGPIDKLKSSLAADRVKYVVGLIPQLQKLGWITADSRQWYQNNLRDNNIENVHKRATEDLKSGKITTEILSLIESIR